MFFLFSLDLRVFIEVHRYMNLILDLRLMILFATLIAFRLDTLAFVHVTLHCKDFLNAGLANVSCFLSNVQRYWIAHFV